MKVLYHPNRFSNELIERTGQTVKAAFPDEVVLLISSNCLLIDFENSVESLRIGADLMEENGISPEALRALADKFEYDANHRDSIPPPPPSIELVR